MRVAAAPVSTLPQFWRQPALTDVNVTCHIARHSFATLILSYDIPMENLKRMLGHKNIAVTQIYGKILKSNVEKNVTKKLKKLK